MSQENPRQSTLIFTDGASSGNPGPGGWAAILLTPDGNVSEIGGSETQTTNNRMELKAPIEALKFLNLSGLPIEIYTDSTYVIRGITSWIFSWMKNGWKSTEGNPIANEDLWRLLYAHTQDQKIQWKYVRGHSGVPGNERVDQIAVQFSKLQFPKLYCGPMLNYSIPLLKIPSETEPFVSQSKNNQKRGKSHSHFYLSLIGNIPMRHVSWEECERRVKGQSGAKFKKVSTPEEAEKTLSAWGFQTTDLKE